MKQVPLAFVLMSRRSYRDYKKVLKKVRRITGGQPDAFCVDFEAGVWKALRKVFPDCPVQGCAFHWSQAVWRKIQGLGLATEYLQKTQTYTFCQKLLSLPLLPAEHIPVVFQDLRDRATDHLRPLVQYVERSWISNTTFPPEAWSVFGQSIRTNNDVEGWHRRFNEVCRGTPPFYLLVKTLHQEAGLVDITHKLMSEGKVRRTQRRKYRELQGLIFEAWDKYSAGEISASRLLRKVSGVYQPSS